MSFSGEDYDDIDEFDGDYGWDSGSDDDGNPWKNLNRVPVIPPGAKAVWLSRPSSLPVAPPLKKNTDDSSTDPPIIRCINHEHCLESNTTDELANKTETVGNTSRELLSSDVQATALNGDDAALPVSSDFSCILEEVSVHLRTVLLDKCTVLELHSNAAVSRRIREGAIATMEKRLLNIRFGSDERYCDDRDKAVDIPVMFIEDISDQSRNTRIEFARCYSKDCQHWPTLKNLLLFCGFANIKRIQFGSKSLFDPVVYPNHFAMRHGRSSNTECSFDEFFADELKAYSCECIELLKVVSARAVELEFKYNEAAGLDAILNSRGMISVESIIVKVSSPFPHINDEQMLNLRAHSIVYYTSFEYDTNAYLHLHRRRPPLWTHVGVSKFIEQWLLGSREIKKVLYQLPMYYDDNDATDPSRQIRTNSRRRTRKTGPAASGRHSLYIDVYTNFNDDVVARLQKILDEELKYEFVFGLCANISLTRVTASDGRNLKIVVSQLKNGDRDYPIVDAGFIFISPSN